MFWKTSDCMDFPLNELTPILVPPYSFAGDSAFNTVYYTDICTLYRFKKCLSNIHVHLEPYKEECQAIWRRIHVYKLHKVLIQFFMHYNNFVGLLKVK